MVDYTKFKLKPDGELTGVLDGKDKLFVIACNKCFKEFSEEFEPECGEFEALANKLGKTVVGSANIDFLCNSTLWEKNLADSFAGAENVFVISCGIGIQAVADFTEKPVYAASDSITYTGHHGMALTEQRCEACGQCYLNTTAGVCPIVDCAKSLVNGQCGGAKNGKCEVDKDKDCGWEKIYRRYEQQGRVDELTGQPIQFRDHSKINFKFVNEYVKSVRKGRFEGYYGGIHPTERKELSEHFPLVRFPEPKTVVIPMSQHTGAPAEPIVQVGDCVHLGQKIGEAPSFVSSPIHSSVSGTVTAIEPRLHPTSGAMVMSIVIDSDGKNTLHESVKPCGKGIDELTTDEVLDIVREKGIVGMGGAGFPTSVKLKVSKPIDTVLLNGCECEPLLTADHRVLLEYADDIIYGLRVLVKTVNAAKGIIVIEDNKRDAIDLMNEKLAAFPNLEVVVARTKYPQGAEKMLIKRVLGRQVPSGGLPLDVGAIVANISTAKAVSDAVQTGMPLVERAVTVTGEKIKSPGNFIVKIGTPVASLVEHCGGTVGDNVTIKMGGPMMGAVLTALDVPILKTSNGVIAVDTDVTEAVPCIKCGRCVDVCPMELKPLYYQKYADEENWQGMLDKSVRDCIECGCCE